MQDYLSSRAQVAETSPTMALAVAAENLRKQDLDVINLGIGEPDFDTPDIIKKAGVAAIDSGMTKYTPADGLPELKEAIAHKLKRDNQLHFTPQEIIVTPGTKLALHTLAMGLINPQDEIIIPTPFWASYQTIFQLAEGKVILIPTTPNTGFKMTADQLAQAIGPKTKVVLFNSPNNPSGMAYTEKEWAALGAVLLKNPHTLIISDEIYEYIFWGKNPYCNLLNVCPELKSRFILVNGVSKNYAMTGWRIGFAAGPIEVIKGMNKLQSQIFGSPATPSQKAAITAFMTERNFFEPMIKTYKERHDIALTAIKKMQYIDCLSADGAFYLLIDVKKALDHWNMNSDVELCTAILNESWVSLVPGTFFGIPGFVRLSFSVEIEKLQEALKRLKKWFG